jgi:hypothetical protein
MHRTRVFALAALALLALPLCSAQAGISFSIGLGWPFGHPWHHHCSGARVYVAPAPVYVVPAAPPPVVVQPAPAVAVPVAPGSPPPAPAPVVPRNNP